MRFKPFYMSEGRNKWNCFEVKRCTQRWSFKNIDSGKMYYMKLGDKVNDVGDMQKFLTDTLATDHTTPKTRGDIDYKQFAVDVINGKKSKVHIKSGKWNDLSKTWILDNK